MVVCPSRRREALGCTGTCETPTLSSCLHPGPQGPHWFLCWLLQSSLSSRSMLLPHYRLLIPGASTQKPAWPCWPLELAYDPKPPPTFMAALAGYQGCTSLLSSCWLLILENYPRKSAHIPDRTQAHIHVFNSTPPLDGSETFSKGRKPFKPVSTLLSFSILKFSPYKQLTMYNLRLALHRKV